MIYRLCAFSPWIAGINGVGWIGFIFLFFLFLFSFISAPRFFFLVLILFPAKGAEPNRRTGNISPVFLSFSLKNLHGVAPGVSKFRLSLT